VYYHQSIPFYNYKWNVLKKNERYLWFYKNIYPIFVKLFIKKNTEFFVQLGYIREHFCRKFNTSKEKIHVIFPKIEIPKIESDEIEELNHQKFNLFYPATSQSYKNHELIFNALKRIDNKLKRKIVLYLTNSKSEFDFDYTYNNIEIVFLGKISFSKVIWFYKNVDCLLFPSYMETLGLPLIEAASCGLKIIAADLPYAREVLQGYKGVTFARYDNENIWSNILLTESNVENTQKYEEFLLKDRDSWDKFFKIIKQNSNV
jgi:glycosyltransferase involved in cell wall biosynthesis